MQPIPIWQDRIINPQVLEDFDDGQRRAGQNALLCVVGVEEADVLVHIENVAVREAFDVFGNVDDLLEVLVLPVVEDGVVHYDAVDGGVSVGGYEGVFEVVAGGFAEGEVEATGRELY